MKEAQPFPRSTVIIAFGPFVGAAAMFVFISVMTASWEDPDPWDSLWRGAILYLVFGWAAGLLPAIVSALVWRFAIGESGSLARRAVTAILIGFVTGTLLIWPFMTIFFGPYAPDFRFNLLAGICGAIALLATALPGGKS